MALCICAYSQNGSRGQLKAGAARIDVTPDALALPANQLGIVNHTHVRAIVFTNGQTVAGFVNVDGNFNGRVTSAVGDRLEKELGIKKANLIWSGTHSHSSGTVQGDDLSERVFQVVKTAYQNMVPAKVGFGNGVCYLNTKRDLFDAERGSWWEGPDYDGKSDKTVSVMYFESMDGKPIATYFNYAMHAVITGQLDMICTDFPGYAEEYIESKYGEDFVAMFTTGAAGDQNPLYFQQTFDLRDIRIADYAKRGEDISNKMPPGGQGLDRNNPEVQRLMGEQKQMALSYGQILGEEVKYVIMMMRRLESNVTLNCETKLVQVPGRRQTNGGGRAGYAGEYEDAPDQNIGLSLIMLDDIPVCGVSGEPYNPIAVRLKRESPYARTFMVTVCAIPGGLSFGYIPDDESYGAQVFEVLSSPFKQGYAESAIVNGLLDMIHDATH